MSNACTVKKIGIMGGTFDPVHFGHLRAAEEAREALSLEKVVFIPAGCPPHKDGKIASAEDRYNMTELATRDCPYFSASRIETDSCCMNYTLDTIKKLKKNPEFSAAELYFITGFDAVLDIMSWRKPDELVRLCRFVTVSRSGYQREKLDELPENIRQAVIPIEIPLLVISSTDIRRRIESGQSIRYLVPDTVESYIREKRLYV